MPPEPINTLQFEWAAKTKNIVGVPDPFGQGSYATSNDYARLIVV